jgi:hypothetical protein
METLAPRPEADAVASNNPHIRRDDDTHAAIRTLDSDVQQRRRSERLDNLDASGAIASVGRRQIDIVWSNADEHPVAIEGANGQVVPLETVHPQARTAASADDGTWPDVHGG